jgi:putative hemolysin
VSAIEGAVQTPLTIQRSKATVVPIWFGGQNSRLFQIASHVSQVLRLSLIFREVKAHIGAVLPVAIGEPIPYSALRGIADRQTLADILRDITYALATDAPARSADRRKPKWKLKLPLLPGKRAA